MCLRGERTAYYFDGHTDVISCICNYDYPRDYHMLEQDAVVLQSNTKSPTDIHRPFIK